MKRILFLLCALLLLCGCSKQAAAETEPEKQGVSLKVVTSYGYEDGNRRHYEAAIARYEQSTGNTVIDHSDISNEEWKARVLTDFETGSEPDVLFFFTNADAEPFIRAGKVVSIPSIRRDFPDYAANMDDEKLPVASNGYSYAVPINGYWEYLYVNTAVLQACGIPIPGEDYTWEQFLKDCAVIRDAGYTPIACSLSEVSHYWFEYCVMNNGSADTHWQVPMLSEDGTLADNAAARKWIAGLEDIRELYELGFFPQNTLTVGDTQTVALFGEGKAAFLLDGSWKVGFFTENYPDILSDLTLCYVPGKGERQATDTVGGISTGFFITRKAWSDPQKQAAAVEFVSQLTSDETIADFVTTELTALRRDVEPEGFNPLQQAAARAKAGTTKLAAAVQDSISPQARSCLFANIAAVVTGKMTAQEAVAAAMALNE